MTKHVKSTNIVAFGLMTCDNDLEYAYAKSYLNELEKQDLAHVRPSFEYWKKKFDRLEKEHTMDQIKVMYEEWLFTDFPTQKERDVMCGSKYNVVQIVMKMFLNMCKKMLWESRNLGDPKWALREAFGQTPQDLVDSVMKEICAKHGTTIEQYTTHIEY